IIFSSIEGKNNFIGKKIYISTESFFNNNKEKIAKDEKINKKLFFIDSKLCTKKNLKFLIKKLRVNYKFIFICKRTNKKHWAVVDYILTKKNQNKVFSYISFFIKNSIIAVDHKVSAGNTILFE